MAEKISASGTSFRGREREYVNDCLSRGWITQGKYVRQFEESFATLCGVKHAVACSSGTSALHLALLSLDLRQGDAVVVPALTYVATANAARYCGADVYFADVLSDSWTIDPNSAYQAFIRACGDFDGDGSRFIVPIPVHIYDSLASRFQTWDDSCVVTDSSQAVAARSGYELGLISTFSFYASKVISCGEGGMVVTNDDGLCEKLRLFRGQGATTPGRYHHSVVGYNYRMTDLQAAIGLAQLERLPEMIGRRHAIVERYRRNLASSGVTVQGGERASAWSFAVLLPEDSNRDIASVLMSRNGIETRPFFDPIPSLPPYQGCDQGSRWAVAAGVASRGLCLPTHTDMTASQVDRVCDELLAASLEARRGEEGRLRAQ